MWLWIGVAAAAEPDWTWTGGPLGDVAVADFDGDGVDDLAWSSGTTVVWFALGPDLVPVELPSVPETRRLGAADIDGDGADDLLVTDESTSGDIYVHRGGPAGPDPVVVWDALPRIDDVRNLGDVNGDGFEDLGLGNTLWLGDAGGPIRQSLALGGALYAAGDRDGDGRDDVLLAPLFGLTLHRGTPDGIDSEPVWGLQQDYREEELFFDPVLVDIDQDGVDEIAVLDVWQGLDGHTSIRSRIRILDDIGTAAVQIAQSALYEAPTPIPPLLESLGDLLVVGERGAAEGRIVVAGELVASGDEWLRPSAATHIAVLDHGDVDADGLPDLVTGWNGLSDGTLSLYLGQPADDEPPPDTTPPPDDPPVGDDDDDDDDEEGEPEPPAPVESGGCGCGTGSGPASALVLLAAIARRRPAARGARPAR